MYNYYETLFFLNPNISSKSITESIDDVRNTVKKYKGKNIFLKILTRKEIAWVCKKHKIGTLIYHKFIVKSNCIEEYRNILKSNEQCILMQIILLNKNIDFNKYIENKQNYYSICSPNSNISFLKEITSENDNSISIDT